MSKTPRIGDLFTHEGQTYKVTRVPTFSSVVGHNVNVKLDSGGPDIIKVPIREIEIIVPHYKGPSLPGAENYEN